MKRTVLKIYFIIFIIFIIFGFVCVANLFLKLPYEKNEKFLVTQGYQTNFTHKIGTLDEYALDFDQESCQAYGKPVLAVADGEVVAVLYDLGQKKGYGNAVKIKHNNDIWSIYAHLKESIVKEGEKIKQGQIVGYVGNTGNVYGQSCSEHPGTHLHFAMYERQPDGKLVAYKPEPMSGYENFVAGNWYVSDNEIFVPKFVEEQQTQSSLSQFKPSKNFWQTLGSFFSGLWQNITDSINNLLVIKNKTPETKNEELKNESSNEISTDNLRTFYDAKLVEKNPNQDLTIKENEVLNLSIKFRNTGTTIWKKEIVSLNVASDEAKKFYHPSWLTFKRPTKLKESEVKPNEIGSFDFLITASNLEPKIYNSSFRPVYQDSNGFHWLGAEIVSWQIAFQKQEEKMVLKENLNQSANLNESNFFDNFSQKMEEENTIKDEKQKPEPIYNLGSGGNSGRSESVLLPAFQDITPPEITLINHPINPTNLQQVTFEFSANEPVTFKCKLDENEKEDCSSPKIYKNLSEGEHSFFLEAFDQANNQSSLVYLWQIDLTSPNSEINTSGIFNEENLPSFIDGTFKDDDIEKVEVAIQRESDGQYLHQESPFSWQENEFWFEAELDKENKKWQFEWPKEIIEEGNYKIYSRAKDKAGNLENPIRESSFTFDKTPPPKIENINFQKNEKNLIFSWPEIVDNFSGLDFYEVGWQTGDGEENFIQTKDLNFTLENIDEKKFYYFRVRGVDLAKNYGQWSEKVFYQPLPFLENWSKRKTIIIDNTNSQENLINFEINVLINYEPEMNNDFSDIRFTDEDGQTLLNYGWDINDEGQELKIDGVQATAVVKIPFIPAQGQKRIYLYYGNSNAQPVANLENTLTWFDHFETMRADRYYPHRYMKWEEENSRVILYSTASVRPLVSSNPLELLRIKNFWLKARIGRSEFDSGLNDATKIYWRENSSSFCYWYLASYFNYAEMGHFCYSLRGYNVLAQQKIFSPPDQLFWHGEPILWEIKAYENKEKVKIGEYFSNQVITQEPETNQPGSISIFNSWVAGCGLACSFWEGPNPLPYSYLDYLYIRQYVEPMPIVYFE